MVCVSFVQGEICADFLFGCLFFLWWARLSEVVILSADYLVCIFILFVVQMRCPTQGATDDWVMAGLVFKWFPLWVLTIWYSLRLVLWWSGCLESVLPLQRLRAWYLVGMKIPQVLCYGIEIKTYTPKWETKDEPQTNGSYKIRKII